MDEGRNAFLAEARSGASESSAPASSPAVKSSSLLVWSHFCSSDASNGTRNPPMYQREGSSGSSSRSCTLPGSGPVRSSRRARISSSRTSADFIAVLSSSGELHLRDLST